MEAMVLSSDELVEFAEGLARIASSGGGVKALAAHVAGALSAAVLVEDAEWRHVALAGANARSIPPSARELIAAAGRDAGENGIRLPGRGDAADGLAVRIRSGDAPLGWLAVFPSLPGSGTPRCSRDCRRTLTRRRRREESPPLVLGSARCSRLRRSDRSARRCCVARHHVGRRLRRRRR